MGRASETVCSEIERDIESGALAPGQHLDEQGLAERFAVSRTPAREALMQLESRGLIKIVPRQGAIVLGLSPQLAAGMMEVLHALEAEVARLACRRMSQWERVALEGIHVKAKPIVDRANLGGYLKANDRFHEAIYAGARNNYLGEQISLTRKRLNFHRRSSIERPGRIAASWSEHRRVLDAILAGDELAARDAMADHCSLGGTAFADMIAMLASADK